MNLKDNKNKWTQSFREFESCCLEKNTDFQKNKQQNLVRKCLFQFYKLQLVLNRFLSILKEKNKNLLLLEKEFASELDTIFSNLFSLEKDILSESLRRKLKRLFREIFKPYIIKGEFTKRGINKPSGFVGDYIMLEGMYNGKIKTRGLGRLWDSYYINHDYVKAVVSRKERMKANLYDFLNNADRESVNILNLASGSCREIRELLDIKSIFLKRVKYAFTLIDQDQRALNFSSNRMDAFPKNVSFKFVKNDVLDFLKSEREEAYDFIYSIGLADYLPDSILKLFIVNSVRVLRKGGVFFLAHKNVKKVSAPGPDWLCDWRFIPRNCKDIMSLLKTTNIKKETSIKVEYIHNDLVFFIQFAKGV